jgi:uncharacterized protein (TIGR01319 family)
VRVALLADFGSTFTKVIAVDLARAALVGQAQAPTTAGGEILDGYEDAARAALGEVRGPVRVVLERAGSSAGGGLRMVAVGLVPSLTAAAARAAALNAGARLAGVLAGGLTDADAAELERLDPEIVLFAGGTDGGQEQLVLRNAAVLAGALRRAHVVVACNRDVAVRVRKIFEPAARSVTIAANVLPDVGAADTGDARRAVSRVFIGEVIAGKKLSASGRFAALVAMATPDAVLRAAELLAATRPDQAGDGVLVTDVGGATTDVYSVLTRRPLSGFGTQDKGLPAGAALRTVEGDLGIRSNAPGVLEADDRWLQSAAGGPPGGLADACARRAGRPGAIFAAGPERELDERLAVSCMFRALERHCGSRGVRPGVAGRPVLVQQGRNLSGCRTLIAGGGIVRASAGARLARQALDRLPEPVLAPRRCRVLVDRRYVLAAAGLLAQPHREIAESLLSRELLEEPAHEGQ